MVWREKYSRIGASTARSTSSDACTLDQVAQSCASSAPASMPSAATVFVMSSRLGMRALPPRRPKLTQPSLAGQISWVLPIIAPARRPRSVLPGVARGRCHVRRVDALRHGEVNSLAIVRPQRGQGGVRGLAATVRVAGRFGAAHRRAVGIAGRVHVPTRGQHAEVRRTPRGARAREPERSDAHPHGVGGTTGIERQRTRRARGVDHDVGVGEQLVERGIGRVVDHHRRLARRPRGPAVGLRAERVAVGRLDEDDLGPEVAQHAARDRPGFSGEVEHPHAFQQPARHRRVSFRTASGLRLAPVPRLSDKAERPCC